MLAEQRGGGVDAQRIVQPDLIEHVY